MLVSALCGYFLVQNTKPKTNGCEESEAEPVLERNKLQKRVKILVNASNEPCEDRFNCYQLKNINGYYSAVFDGHGGWQVSQFAMKNMHLYIDEELKKHWSIGEKEIKLALHNAFVRTEEEWLKVAKLSFHNGFPKAGYVGSCALVAIVHENKVYVANAGDSKATILRKNGEGFERVKASTTFNANKKYEQNRLRSEFRGEKDAVVCKRGGAGACYVKGNLMPTRALGDFRLKSPEFNFHNYSYELGYRRPIPKENYTGPYISPEPDVQVFELDENDRFLILASDGLWDELNRKKSAEIASSLAKKNGGEVNGEELVGTLMGAGLDLAAKKSGISRDYLS